MSTHRMERVESVITQTISTMLVRGEIKDPRVSTLVSVSDISVAKDLSFARIGISGFLEGNKLEKAVEGLNSASGFIQVQLGKAMKTRLTPKLQFYVDKNVKAAFEMSRKIEELIHDDSQKGNDPT